MARRRRRSSRKRWVSLGVALAIAAGFARPAEAQADGQAALTSQPAPDHEAVARTLFEAGVAMARQQRWAEAEDSFRSSYALVPRRSTAYNLALTLLHAGRGRETLELLAELSHSSSADGDPYQAELPAMRARALELVARVLLEISPPTAALRVDGVLVAGGGAQRELIVDPGTHEFALEAPGHAPRVARVSARAGELVLMTIALEPLAEPAPLPAAARATAPAESTRAAAEAEGGRSYLGPIVLAGAGGAVLIGAAITGALALQADADIDARCPEKRCMLDAGDGALRTEVEWLERQRDDLALATDLLLLGGGLTLGSALVWALLPDSDGEGVRFEAAVDRIDIRGRWYF